MNNNGTYPINRCNNLSIADFKKESVEEKYPVIISNSLDWGAMNKWSMLYFKDTYHDASAVVTILKPGINLPGTTMNLKFSELIDLMCYNSDKNKKHYLMQKSIYEEFPELLSDISLPKYTNKNNKYTINLWISEADVNTRPHYDASNNFLVQVVGRKRVRLFAPSDTSNLYPYTIKDTIFADSPAVHVSQIADIDLLTSGQFPNVKLIKCFEDILHPGDLLFIPAGWWHEIRALDISISVNFFWQTRLEALLNQQVTEFVCSAVYWYGTSFEEKIRNYFDLSDFDNDLQIAEFALLINLKCVAAVFLLQYIRKICIGFVERKITGANMQDSYSNQINYNNKIQEWQRYLELGKKGDNNLLQKNKIIEIINNIKLCGFVV